MTNHSSSKVNRLHTILQCCTLGMTIQLPWSIHIHYTAVRSQASQNSEVNKTKHVGKNSCIRNSWPNWNFQFGSNIWFLKSCRCCTLGMTIQLPWSIHYTAVRSQASQN